MGLRKFGEGEVIPDKGKTATTSTWSAEDQQALEAENDSADKEG
jgi:hypothetical protein